MATAAQEASWNHTASLLAMTANVNRDTKKRRKPFEPMEFHPMSSKGEPVKQSMTDMKEQLMKAFNIKQVD